MSEVIFYMGYLRKEDAENFKKIVFRTTRGGAFAYTFDLKVKPEDIFTESERMNGNDVSRPFHETNYGYIIMSSQDDTFGHKILRIT